MSDSEKVRRAFFRDVTRPSMVLEDFSVARYGRLKNGGDVLFATNPAIRLPQIRIRAMCYSSDKAGDTFSDLKSFEGPLHRIFEEAYSFIIRNTLSIFRFIKGNPKRHNSPLYPEEAVREALINALAHREQRSIRRGQHPYLSSSIGDMELRCATRGCQRAEPAERPYFCSSQPGYCPCTIPAGFYGKIRSR